MKKIVLAALAVLSLGAGVAQAQSYRYERAPAHHAAADSSSQEGRSSGMNSGD